MRTENALAVFEMARDLGRGNGRTVARQHGLRRDRVFEFGEQPLFERQPLRRRLEHVAGPVGCRIEPIVHGNTLQQRGIGVEQFDQRLQTARQRRAALGGCFKDAHDMPGIGQQISNAMPHQAAADDGDFLYFLHLAPCASNSL